MVIILKKGGQKKGKMKRNTIQRRVILEELKKLRTHPSAIELYSLVRRKLPKISLGTVYRNLEAMAREGQVLVLASGRGPRRYDGNVENHYHIRCVHCSRVGDIMSDQALIPELKTRPLTDYEVLGVHIEFFGVCPDCQRKKRRDKK
jgi:Fur family ferric uptake transcriptional regulator